MKIIVFGDIHMAVAEAGRIPGIENADLVIVNGDITNYGGKKEAKRVLDEVLQFNPNVLAQFGNIDSAEINTYLEDLGLNLHGQAHLVKGQVCIMGVGGSNPTPFSTPSEFTETELKKIAQHAFQQGLDFISLAKPLHKREIPQIFISHAPPFNTRLDKLYNGKHVGSIAIRSAIEQYQPDLCISGHIHEAKGQDMIDATPVFNHGMLKNGGWISINLQNSQLEVTLQ
jgi:Icc-related predicted phosphoesterase